MNRKKWTRSEKILWLAPVAFAGFVGSALYAPKFSRSLEAMAETVGLPSRGIARTSSCQSNLKQIGLGFSQYERDYDEKFPLVRVSSVQPFGWADSLQPYIKSTALYHCPQNSTFVSTTPSATGYTDYFYNARLSNRNLSLLNNSEQTVLLGEGVSSDARYALSQLPRAWKTSFNSPARLHFQHKSATVNGANYAFVDGHVKWIPPQNIGVAPTVSFGPTPGNLLRPVTVGTFSLR